MNTLKLLHIPLSIEIHIVQNLRCKLIEIKRTINHLHIVKIYLSTYYIL